MLTICDLVVHLQSTPIHHTKHNLAEFYFCSAWTSTFASVLVYLHGDNVQHNGGFLPDIILYYSVDPMLLFNTINIGEYNPRISHEEFLPLHPMLNRMREHRTCARGGCCGRGRCSAWVTTGYPRGSCRESWRTRENVGRGGRRKNGRTAWQRIFGYLASGGTGTLPDLTLGYDMIWYSTSQYVKGAVGLWPRE